MARFVKVGKQAYLNLDAVTHLYFAAEDREGKPTSFKVLLTTGEEMAPRLSDEYGRELLKTLEAESKTGGRP